MILNICNTPFFYFGKNISILKLTSTFLTLLISLNVAKCNLGYSKYVVSCASTDLSV